MRTTAIPSIDEVMSGTARFHDDMPIWEAKFGDLVWPLMKKDSVRFNGATTSAIVWGDHMHGSGATFGHPNSTHRAKYKYCLTAEMVADLKIAAIIHGHYPALIKHARVTRAVVDPKTVKARIDDLAKIFSAAVLRGAARGLPIRRLQDISLSLLKEVIAEHPGRGKHLKRALKLISAPYIQMNLSGPLKWQLVDIEKGTVPWSDSADGHGIQPLPDLYFLGIQDYCMTVIRDFKALIGLPSHCTELAPIRDNDVCAIEANRPAIEALLEDSPKGLSGCSEFQRRFNITVRSVQEIIADAQCASIMILLLLTGMRRSETQFVLDGSLSNERGYWFIKSKVVKQRKKDVPISEGWLAIDIVRDAYEILSYFCRFTKQKYLISSPFSRFTVGHRGYASQSLNTKLSRWLTRAGIDKKYSDWTFSVHQCRETLVAQLANQQVKLPFISMQLKHFHSRFNSMPNDVTAGYGNYRGQLIASVATRLPQSRELIMKDLYAEGAKFAGGGAEAHKARVDAFFAGMGLFGEARVRYIETIARRSSRLQPTSIGTCVRNFDLPILDETPPCFGDYECDPDCPSHVISERGGQALRARRTHALGKVQSESKTEFKLIWMGLADKLERHIQKLEGTQNAV